MTQHKNTPQHQTGIISMCVRLLMCELLSFFVNRSKLKQYVAICYDPHFSLPFFVFLCPLSPSLNSSLPLHLEPPLSSLKHLRSGCLPSFLTLSDLTFHHCIHKHIPAFSFYQNFVPDMSMCSKT